VYLGREYFDVFLCAERSETAIKRMLGNNSPAKSGSVIPGLIPSNGKAICTRVSAKRREHWTRRDRSHLEIHPDGCARLPLFGLPFDGEPGDDVEFALLTLGGEGGGRGQWRAHRSRMTRKDGRGHWHGCAGLRAFESRSRLCGEEKVPLMAYPTRDCESSADTNESGRPGATTTTKRDDECNCKRTRLSKERDDDFASRFLANKCK
jgi:hypothetical protein